MRVYPDKVHLDSHEPSLDADEMLWGTRFWEVQWADATKRREAWRMLAGRFGPERACLGGARADPDQPRVTPVRTPRNSPTSEHLPPRRALRGCGCSPTLGRDGVRGGVVAAVAPDATSSRTWRSDLTSRPTVTIDDEPPAVDAGMRWMIDFDRAEEAGMALRLALPSPAVDVLLVAGVASGRPIDAAAPPSSTRTATPTGSPSRPAASPTNDTAAGSTAYQEPDPQHEQSFAREWDSDETARGSNARCASKAFGVESFSRLASGVDHDDDRRARWRPRSGRRPRVTFLAQMIGFDGTGLTPAGRDWARAHALSFCGRAVRCRRSRRPTAIWCVAGDIARPLDGHRDGGDEAARCAGRLRDVVFRPPGGRAPRRPDRQSRGRSRGRAAGRRALLVLPVRAG